MILFQMLIHLYYMGIIQIGHLHAISMEQEENHKEQLELELETFENEMNPDLLMDCLETLISLIHFDIQDTVSCYCGTHFIPGHANGLWQS